ncbi:ABC transporter ATP-binding protein [Arthrobacter sp. HMWF013]|uniref:ABC transporter ATP-binding protein n=1 Tax=Arthrobacter sp. HMWF013 TaxID=2056849 RepID=UPI000D3BD871|nr:ATP-binding cassette domain-containing protein [Arthrobacter sp. HMWF013]PTT70398.1 ABC transporter ATP-binding protein [Arthrobacter sp. HMWF013]
MNTSSAPLLQVEGLTKKYGTGASAVTAVDEVSFTIGRGETLGLVGESGSGKSTTGFCVLQLTTPTSGSVKLEGVELVGLSSRRLRSYRKEMQIVFQDPYDSLNPRMTVQQIVAEPLRIHSRSTRSGEKSKVHELLELVGISPDMADRYPASFSGGQRQRISIARALALNPKLIVCDEAVSALDVSIQAQIINLLRDLQDELSLSYLFISHDLAVVRAVADSLAVMRGGRIVESGPADTVFERPATEYTQALMNAVPVPNHKPLHNAEKEFTA